MNTRDMMRDVTSDIASGISFIDPKAASWSVDFTVGALPAGLTFSRASGATYLDTAGALQTVVTNVARLDANPATLQPRGLLIEEQRTNFLLNSTSPVTQTVSLSVGTYVLWLAGSGSCTVAAGTAAGTGFGMANASTSMVFTLTTAGTVSFTVAGGVARYQCENGAFATSFIPTAASATTRAVDVCYVDSNVWLNQPAGSLMVEAEAFTVSTTQKVVSLQPGAAETTMVAYNLAAGSSSFTVKYANATVAQLNFTKATVGVVFKYECAFRQDDFVTCMNGGALATDTLGGMPLDLTRLYIGIRSVSNLNPLNGWVRKIAYTPRRMSNTELQQITA